MIAVQDGVEPQAVATFECCELLLRLAIPIRRRAHMAALKHAVAAARSTMQVQVAAVLDNIAEDAGVDAVAAAAAARAQARAAAHSSVKAALEACGVPDLDVEELTEADARTVREAVRYLDEELVSEPAGEPLAEVSDAGRGGMTCLQPDDCRHPCAAGASGSEGCVRR